MTTADGYRRWADTEARGVSPTYEDWARGLAGDAELVARLDALPPAKRQPNLVFASARLAGVPTGPWTSVAQRFRDDWDAIVAVASSHATQTNEPGRCAVLLPLLARIEGPLALLEVGASAGLCLVPDRYAYAFETDDGRTASLMPVTSGADGRRDPPPVLRSRLSGLPAPARLPEVTWRAGLDLQPIDPRDAAAQAWLEALIWPGPMHDERRDRLRAGIDLVRDDPPRVDQGDLVDALPELAAAAPSGATLVVFHTAVLAYVSDERRSRFVEAVRRLQVDRPGTVWISNEGERVLPEVAARLRASDPRTFVLAQDGVPVGRTGPHGQSLAAA